MSWVKHDDWTANRQDCVDCGDACNFSLCGGSGLCPGCSDIYGCQNGDQMSLGPRSQVNAWTGGWPVGSESYCNPVSGDVIACRLQVKSAVLAVGITYFLEQQIITPDETAANRNNNVSYKATTVGPCDANLCIGQVCTGTDLAAPRSCTDGCECLNLLTVSGTPNCQQPAIKAWKDNDPGVFESTPISDLNDGKFILAAKARNVVSGCLWEYEYALYNMNSDKSAGSFRVPLPAGLSSEDLQDIRDSAGFHGIPYHSGEPYSAIDWTATVVSGSITWATTPFEINPNANALRWGTLYNFRFQAKRAPVSTETVTIGLFKPPQGDLTPVSVTPTASPVGACCLPDTCTVETTQTSCACQGGAFLGTGTTCTGPDCNCNAIPDSCDIASGTSPDSNENGVPDECESPRACCLPNSSCVVTTACSCAQGGGTVLPQQTFCETTYRACCRPPPYEDCVVTTHPCCDAVGGTFWEFKLKCKAVQCPSYNGPSQGP